MGLLLYFAHTFLKAFCDFFYCKFKRFRNLSDFIKKKIEIEVFVVVLVAGIWVTGLLWNFKYIAIISPIMEIIYINIHPYHGYYESQSECVLTSRVSEKYLDKLFF